ncbi:hypothetical protein AAF712_008487 [Marasmius tenuissimus]|uniref:N-acetyltransferase domain-containing protein n=1 Tax=Marasmius tenuissimus TaxID=585030 RepID=A0ABR2ZW67_9AGAR
MTQAEGIFFDLVSSADLEDAIAIETASYPEDEAATLPSFEYRQSHAGDLFLGCFLPNARDGRRIIGYICSTLANGETLTHESMSKHVPGATSVCIHSVCVSFDHRRQGIALRLLKEYIARLEEARRTGSVSYERILLIAHEELIPLYRKAGFTFIGESEVAHGARPWYSMSYQL